MAAAEHKERLGQPAQSTCIRMDFSALEDAIQYKFQNVAFLERALTHKSYCYDCPDGPPLHYEALEFLGDAILGFVISDLLFQQIPSSTEGQLSKVKAHLVSAGNLLQFAQKLQLGQYLRLSHGEEKTGGRGKKALQVDAFEALIAAIYLDGGIQEARRFIASQFGDALHELAMESFTSPDYKSRLQERLHQLGHGEPMYTVLEESGPDHSKRFTVQVVSGRSVLACGEGSTKKQAQQKAAEAALLKLMESSASGTSQ